MKSCEKSEKIISERQKVRDDEYMLARFLHDRFCKFEIPYRASETIQTIRLIKQIIPLEELKEADLSFKLNNLRWFLTADGKKFLVQARKDYQLGLKRLNLNLDKPAELIQKTIDQNNNFTYNPHRPKNGEDRVFENKKQAIIDFII